MLIQFKKLVTATAVSALTLTPIATAGLILTADVSFAKGAKKPKKEKRSRKPAKEINGNGHGAIASVLKNLNAVNSMRNGQGYLNANADSNVGMISTAAYTVFALGEAETALSDYENDLYPTEAFDFVEEGGIDCEAEAGLEQCVAIADYNAFVETEAYSIAIMDLNNAVVDAGVDRDLAYSAIGADELVDPALGYFEEALSFAEFSETDPFVTALTEAGLDF